ncbi:MAG: thioredoxin [Candidatus Thermoplasmatota archaeon]
MHNTTADDPLDAELRALRDQRLAEAQRAARTPRQYAPIILTDETLADAVASTDLLVVDVWAPWCGPCRVIGPILDDLARELAGTVTIGKLNADENGVTMARYGIMGIPTMLVFKRGKLVDKIVGAAPKSVLKETFLQHAA